MSSDVHSGPVVPSWVEIISADGHPLTYIIRGGQLPDRTTFLTPPEFKQQVGYVAYPAGGVIARHMHVPIHRHLIGTSEVLVVLKGPRLDRRIRRRARAWSPAASSRPAT